MANQFYDLKTLSISHSSRSMFRSCPRKLEMRKFYLHDSRDSSFAADVGTCLHTGYQTYMATKNEDKAIIAMMLDYPVNDRFDDKKNKDRTLEACYSTLMTMIASDTMGRYELAKIKCLDGTERLAVEVPFEIYFEDFSLDENVPVTFIGWIDCIFYDKVRDIYIVVDVKTSRQYGDDFTAKYNFDEQCLPYGFVLENILGHSIQAFEVAYLSCFVDLLAPKARFYEFTKTRDMVFDWAQGLYYDLRQIEQFYRTGWFPRATSGDTCMAYGRVCQFYDECGFRDHETIKNIIMAPAQDGVNNPVLNRRGEWNPWLKIPMRFGV